MKGEVRRMKSRLCILFALAALLAAGAVASAKLDPQAEKAARDYLTALSKNDRDTMKRLSPSKLENYYGPFMFKRLPGVRSPKVDGHRAAIEFVGESIDPELPASGSISLVKEDARTTDAWVVRQIIWHAGDRLPLGVKLPKESSTEEDRKQEFSVAHSARKFLAAWQDQNFVQMKHLSFDWLSRKAKSPDFVKLRKLTLTEGGVLEGATKVTYEAQLTVFGILPQGTRGFVYVLKEGEVWKVRGNNVSF